MKPILEYLLSKNKKANPIDEYGEWLIVVPYGADYSELEEMYADSYVQDLKGGNPDIFIVPAVDAIDIIKHKLDKDTTVCKIPSKFNDMQDFADAYEEGQFSAGDFEEIAL